MIPIITSRFSSCCCRFRHLAERSLLLLPVIACVFTCVSCTEQGPPMVDITPLGDGLKVIGYAVLGVGVLGVLSKLVK